MQRTLSVILLAILALSCLVRAGQSQTRGRTALDAFLQWKAQARNQKLKWEEALDAYKRKLKADGLSEQAAESNIRLVTAYDEAELYDQVYSVPPKFNTQPNNFLVDAVAQLPSGEALDVGMGQGRNSIYLASRGWRVTGFDVAEVGLRKARAEAARLGLSLTALHAADEEFDFGRERWDLIVIVYAIEKRSVYRVRHALKPGGIVVIESAHREPGGYPFGYESNELLKILDGFRILRYEERLGVADFEEDRSKRELLVRLMAQKPR